MRGSMRWYMNRLRAMSLPEIGYRVRSAAHSAVIERAPWLDVDALRRHVHAPQMLRPLKEPALWIGVPEQLSPADRHHVLAAADLLVAGQWRRLDGVVQALDLPTDWSLPPSSSDTPPVDPRLWMELHRHAHLVVLAQAHALSADEKYLTALKAHLQSWIEACPREAKARGPAWSSALDVALRLLNWSIVWQLLARQHNPAAKEPHAVVARLGETLASQWLALIPVHVHAIRGNLSRHSSANNRRMGELLGLFVADATWPYWPQHQRWADQAWHELCTACLSQVGADGVNREQASWYLSIAFELLAVAWCIAQAQERPTPQFYRDRLAAMPRFASALCTSGGHVQHHGDADDAYACGLLSANTDALHRMLGLAQALGLTSASVNAAPVARQAGIGAWIQRSPMLDGLEPNTDDVARLNPPPPRRFDDGGYYLLGRNFGQPDEIKLIADAGELGYMSIAAHGHADALSLRLSVAGLPMLVDRGTGYYNIEPHWRRYLRGTLAHNTLCLDEQDQSEYGGPFLWLRKAQSKLAEFNSHDNDGVFRAAHDGYARLPGQPTHSREIRWDGERQSFRVLDAVSSRAEHQAVVAWHFSPACSVEIVDGLAIARCGPVTLRLSVDALLPGAWRLHRGPSDSLLGWHSPAFGRVIPAPTLLWHTQVPGTLLVATTIDIYIESDACANKS
jgi:Heparinase II/III-like protein/Heparinase II/III N-terminus